MPEEEVVTTEEETTEQATGEETSETSEEAQAEPTEEQQAAEEGPSEEWIEQMTTLDRNWKKDPAAVVRELATRAGIKLAEDGEEQATAEKPKPLRDIVAESLGAEFEFLADRLAPAIEQVARQIVAAELGPINQNMTQRQVDETLAHLDENYPDWKKFEPAMMELKEKFLPSKKMTMREYAVTLYRIASGDRNAVRKAVDKLTASAKKPAPKTGTASEKIARKKPEGATLKDAFEAAKQGISWE